MAFILIRSLILLLNNFFALLSRCPSYPMLNPVLGSRDPFLRKMKKGVLKVNFNNVYGTYHKRLVVQLAVLDKCTQMNHFEISFC